MDELKHLQTGKPNKQITTSSLKKTKKKKEIVYTKLLYSNKIPK